MLQTTPNYYLADDNVFYSKNSGVNFINHLYMPQMETEPCNKNNFTHCFEKESLKGSILAESNFFDMTPASPSHNEEYDMQNHSKGIAYKHRSMTTENKNDPEEQAKLRNFTINLRIKNLELFKNVQCKDGEHYTKDKFFNNILKELRKQNKLNFQKVLEAKILNQAREKNLFSRLNNNRNQNKIRFLENKPESKTEQSTPIKDQFNLRPITKEIFKMTREELHNMHPISPEISAKPRPKSALKCKISQELSKDIKSQDLSYVESPHIPNFRQIRLRKSNNNNINFFLLNRTSQEKPSKYKKVLGLHRRNNSQNNASNDQSIVGKSLKDERLLNSAGNKIRVQSAKTAQSINQKNKTLDVPRRTFDFGRSYSPSKLNQSPKFNNYNSYNFQRKEKEDREKMFKTLIKYRIAPSFDKLKKRLDQLQKLKKENDMKMQSIQTYC